MHTNISLIEIIFRYSLFGMLAYKMCDLIKLYVIPHIFTQITIEQKQQVELVEKGKLLVATRNRIENQIYTQKQMFTLLEKHVQTWHDAQQLEMVQAAQAQQVIIDRLQEKRELQKQYLALAYATQECIPKILEGALQELTQRCRSSDGRELLHNVIEDMETSHKPFIQGK